jgi:two-component system cell cycle response regulator
MPPLASRAIEAAGDSSSGREEQPTRRFLVKNPELRDLGVLVEAAGASAGRPHKVGAMAVIGRAADCSVRIDDEALSRRHARIVREGGGFALEDMGSLNGCWVGGRRVDRTPLRDGDRVRLGGLVELRFHVVTQDELDALVRLYEAGLCDALTGLANRKQLEERLRAEVSYARRHASPLSLVMIDVDRFKAVNDEHGHLVGDAVLKHVAQVVARTVRVEDLVARFGGEEFVVVARGTQLVGGQQLAERLRGAVERTEIPIDERLVLRMTASLGVASLACIETPDPRALVEKADARMYRAKRAGRNRVVAMG